MLSNASSREGSSYAAVAHGTGSQVPSRCPAAVGLAVACEATADEQTSRNELQFLAALHGLRAAARAQLVEDAARVRLHGVLAHEDAFGNLTIAQSGRDEFEDLEFAPRDAERIHLRLVADELGRRLD